jgi:hypothetical protein
MPSAEECNAPATAFECWDHTAAPANSLFVEANFGPGCVRPVVTVSLAKDVLKVDVQSRGICAPVGPGAGTGIEQTMPVIAVPLSRLPDGMLTVISNSEPSARTVIDVRHPLPEGDSQARYHDMLQALNDIKLDLRKRRWAPLVAGIALRRWPAAGPSCDSPPNVLPTPAVEGFEIVLQDRNGPFYDYRWAPGKLTYCGNTNF